MVQSCFKTFIFVRQREWMEFKYKPLSRYRWSAERSVYSSVTRWRHVIGDIIMPSWAVARCLCLASCVLVAEEMGGIGGRTVMLWRTGVVRIPCMARYTGNVWYGGAIRGHDASLWLNPWYLKSSTVMIITRAAGATPVCPWKFLLPHLVFGISKFNF